MMIKKILNNNVVLTENKDGIEQVVCGRGIAFGKRPGAEIDEHLINQVFELKSEKQNQRFQQIIADIPLEYIDLSSHIIDMIRTEVGQKINDTIYITLTDHMYTAIERAKQGIYMPNTMLWEIRHYYEKEFTIAQQVLKMIYEATGVQLTDDEAGFITLHIVNSETEGSEIEETVKATKIVQDITKIVRYHFHQEFDVDSVYYYRFITHLKFFAQRVVSGKPYNSNEDISLLEIIRKKYQDACDCVEKIADMMKRQYRFDVSDEEKLYLTIHVHRIISIENGNN